MRRQQYPFGSRPSKRFLPAVLAVFVLLFISAAARSQTTNPVEAVAVGFLRTLDTGDLDSLYDKSASPVLQQSMSRKTFTQQAGAYKINWGGPAKSRQLVGSQELDQVPGSTTKGEFYYFRYKTSFPNVVLYQDVLLEKVSGSWKVSGLWFLPVPQQ